MKAISIRQPWVALILNGSKDVENRSWPTNIRGRVYVHAGKQVDRQALSTINRSFSFRMPEDLGAIVGSVEIVDCVTESDSPWFTGPYGFVLANPVKFENPIPCKGQLRFFNVEVQNG